MRAVETVLRLRRGAAHHRRLREPASRRGADRRPGPAMGHGATEAPRGMLYHRYELDDDGRILDAQIVAADGAEPADDRGRPAGRARRTHLDLPDDELRWQLRADRSATTTRASRARPTSSISISNECPVVPPPTRSQDHDRRRRQRCDRRREPAAQRRRSRADGGRPAPGQTPDRVCTSSKALAIRCRCSAGGNRLPWPWWWTR